MKKIIFYLVVLGSAYLLITRFIYYDNPDQAGPPPPFPCNSVQGPASEPSKNLYSCATLQTINQAYLQDIKPIVEQKCLMCHGIAKRLPLYAKIFPSSWLVHYDMREALEHVNMTWDFPFRGKKSLDHRLEEIDEMVKEDEMPPLIYKILHWQSELSPEESQKILLWVKESRSILGKEIPIPHDSADHSHSH